MARDPKMWFRPDRGIWYVTIRQKQHNLGPEESAARRRFHELLAEPEPPTPPPVITTSADPSVLEVCDKFVTFCRQNKAAGTADWYRKHLSSDARHQSVTW